MQAELDSHLRLRAAALQTEGLEFDQANRRARLEFGPEERWQEECREALGPRLLAELRADLRLGLRQLRRHPSFTVAAVLTLALGIGANTAIFSMIEGMLLRTLPYPSPQQLYAIHETVPQWSSFGHSFDVNAGNFRLWQSRCPAFAGMAEVNHANVAITGRGAPRQVVAAWVPATFFPLFGVAPRLGRIFLPAEDQPGHGREALLTNRLWHELFRADPHVIGQTITLESAAYIVVGVLPASFRFPAVWGASTPALYLPLALRGADLVPGVGNFRYTVFARLKPGVSARQALAQINTVEWEIAHRPDPLRHVAAGEYSLYATLTPLKAAILGPAARALWLLWAAAGLLLLIVCANTADLLLAKNAGRAREVALRAALGASSGRLLRQFLTEGALLAASGATVGLAFAAAALQLLVRQAPIGMARVDAVHLDGAVLLFTLGLTVLTTLLFAALPLLLARPQPVQALQAAGLYHSGGPGPGRLRSALVVSEVAASAVLLAGAMLLVQSLTRLGQANHWMQQPQVLALKLVTPPTPNDHGQLERFYDGVLANVQVLPGVSAAAFTPVLPLEGGSWGDDVVFREAPRPLAESRIGDFYFITPGFTHAIGLPLLQGRALAPEDRGKNVVLISATTARNLLPGRNPLGAHLMWSPNAAPLPREVIGVVADVRHAPQASPTPAVYVPLWTFAEPDETLIVRTHLPEAALLPELRRAAWTVDPRVAVARVETLPQVLATSTAPRRYETSLAALFGFCAVLIAAIGLYGVISYGVSQRRREIGIRMALGAHPGDVQGAVVRQGLSLVLLGLGIGLAAALMVTRSLASQLYEIRPGDPFTFGLVTLVLLAVALLACWLPARRATRVDPIATLRCD